MFNPPDRGEKELPKRTLTNPYEEHPEWLAAAVFAPYGWSVGLGDKKILALLLALNRERAG